jgi:hypothetical protein
VAIVARLTGTEMMMDRDTYLKNAADCRERAKADPVNADHWIDEAVIWLQRAIGAGGDARLRTRCARGA